MKNAFNGGNIRSSITIFPQRVSGREDFRLWNHQLYAFAGYSLPDGTVIGDPARIPFTRVCQRLGWQGKGTGFDLLPLVLSGPGEDRPKFYEIPDELKCMIDLEHPTYPWFKDLGLKWYALPAVSDMLFDVGGIEFPAAPFNGWYMGTEIGSRNLLDENRYNLFPVIAEKMGLVQDNNSSLWKDRVMIETNTAVLHSFAKNGITIVDHHTASETFLTHMGNEMKSRGGCPADWVWIVPPMSSSATGVFHQEMVNYQLKPSYEYQEPAWKGYKWGKKVTLKYTFKSIAKSVLSVIKLMKGILSKRIKVSVLYATETGKSEFLSEKLTKTLRENFFVNFKKMDEYDFESSIDSERILFLVASTFGNGDPPDNGKSFWKSLNQRVRKLNSATSKEERERFLLPNLSFSVFGLGSSLYPTFGAFGTNLDKALDTLGGKRIRPVTIGDELRGQQKLFSVWRQTVSDKVVNQFVHLKDEDGSRDEILLASEVGDKEAFNDDFFNRELFRMYVISATKSSFLGGGDTLHLHDMLTKIHGEKKYPNMIPMKVVSRIRLLPVKNSFEKQTILVRMHAAKAMSKSLIKYEPGDHLGVFPCNPSNIVETLLGHILKGGNDVSSTNPKVFLGEDDYFQVEPVVIVQSRDSLDDEWVNTSRLPPCTLREALTHYLDICSCPTPRLLSALSSLANDRWDAFRLRKLSQEPESYKKWRAFHSPNLIDVLNEFPSLHVPPEFILTRLPLLQPRLYSISSSLSSNPEEVHLTMSLVRWQTQSNSLKSGVTTCFLDSLPSQPIPCFIRPAPSFHLPSDLSTPIIMICAGSGIAPFRAFWQERETQVMSLTGGRRLSMAASSKDRQSIGKAILFFGCRSLKVDQLYGLEIEDLLSRGVLHEVFLATSREEGHDKRYVQDEVFDNRTLVHWMVTKEAAHIYVCGDALMADGVRKALVKMFELEGQNKSIKGEDALEDLKDDGRYHEDIYGILRS